MVSFSVFASIVFVLFAGVMYVILSPFADDMVASFNDQVDSGTVSEGTHGVFTFNVMVFKLLPFFSVLGVFLWAIVRGLEKAG